MEPQIIAGETPTETLYAFDLPGNREFRRGLMQCAGVAWKPAKEKTGTPQPLTRRQKREDEREANKIAAARKGSRAERGTVGCPAGHRGEPGGPIPASKGCVRVPYGTKMGAPLRSDCGKIVALKVQDPDNLALRLARSYKRLFSGTVGAMNWHELGRIGVSRIVETTVRDERRKAATATPELVS